MQDRFIRAAVVIVLLAIWQGNAAAGQFLQVTFVGTCYSTNQAGAVTTKRVTQRDWVRDYARINNIRNLSTLALVYHAGADERGDTIEIVNARNGTYLYTVFDLFFSEDFQRIPLVSSDGLSAKRIQFVYNYQNDHSVGSALMDERYILDRSGRTNRFSARGPMIYEVLPDANHPALQICNGTLQTGKPVVFKRR
jgi:hypothetical protein